MAALTNAITGNECTELSGGTRLVSMYSLQMISASDTITMVASTNGITAIDNVFVSIWDKPGSAAASVGASFSGLTVTVNAVAAAGTVATSYPKFNLLVIGTG